MTVPDIIIVVLAAVEVLAVIGMGVAAFLMYRRVQTVSAWARPSINESKAIAARGKATALETRESAMAFSAKVRALVQHVNQKVQTTTRIAREIIHPNLAPLQQAARAVSGPEGLARRLSRLHAAGKIAAGEGNGSESQR
jgi:hypothetical protein